MLSTKKNKEKKQSEIKTKNYFAIKPTWREIFEDWIRFFVAYAVTVTILIILIKYF